MNIFSTRMVGGCVLALALGGCGYHVADRNHALPKSVNVIAVTAMENKTGSYRIEQKLTSATVHEFLTRTRYHIVSDANGGDAILRGKVLSLEVVPLTFESTSASGVATARATSMLVTMHCEVILTERDNDKILYRNEDFLFRNEYELSTDVRNFFQEGDPAVDRMARDFADRLVSAVTENF